MITFITFLAWWRWSQYHRNIEIKDSKEFLSSARPNIGGAVLDPCDSQTLHWSTSNELYWCWLSSFPVSQVLGQDIIRRFFIGHRLPCVNLLLHHIHHRTCDKTQAFPLHFFILQAIKNWRMKRPGNEANVKLGGNLLVSYQDHVLPSETMQSGNESWDLGMRLDTWEWD